MLLETTCDEGEAAKSDVILHLTLGLSLPSPGLPAFLMAEVLLGRKALLAPATMGDDPLSSAHQMC